MVIGRKYGLNCATDNKPLSILVVDDEPVLRELVAFILLDKGFMVTEAESGNAALRKLQDQDFDVVVSDIRMPDGSGIDLLQNISRLDKAKPLVFLVSGYSEVTPEEAKLLGAADLLNKPVDYDLLCKAICDSSGRCLTHSEM